MNEAIKIASLRRSELFVGMSDEDLWELGTVARVVTGSKGKPLYLPSGPGGALCVLMSGQIKLLRFSPNGRECILDIVERGEVFGEMSLLEQTPDDVIAVALEDSSLLAIPQDQLRALVRRTPDLALRMARLIGLRRKKIESRLESVMLRSVPERLAELLLQLGEAYGVPDRRGILLRIRLSQQDIGNFIGASREMVNITLRKFRQQGFIDRAGQRWIIRQPEPLGSV